MEMGTQGSGRRRLPQRERLTAEDDALSQIAREAEARLAAKRAARAEAREIRMKELERQQKEAEERPEKDFAEKGSRNMPSLSAATLASLGGTSSRRGSGDTSISVDTEASMREIKDSLAEVEEKYKKAMVSNAQLDNEKMNFMYQVDTLKDALLELEEQLAESRRQYEEKNKEFERQKHAHSVLQFQFAEAKEALKQREEMLAKHGIILNSEITTNGEPVDNLSNVSHLGSPKLSQQETNSLKSSADGTLGRASEVEVDKVGESAVLQNPEREQPQADSAEAGVDTKALPPDGNAEAETPPQAHAMVPETLAKDPAHVLETPSVPENNNKQVGSSEGGERLGAGREFNHLDDSKRNHVDQNQEPVGSLHFPSDGISQDGYSSLDAENEKKEVAEKQKEGKAEEEGDRKLVQETDLLETPDTKRIDTVMEESLREGMEAKDKIQADTGDSDRAKDGAVSGGEDCTNLMEGEQNKEKAKEFIKEELMQTIPPSNLKSSQPEKAGKRLTTGGDEFSDQNVPTAEGDGQKGQMCDSSSKKSKNKKKKNKKKKAPPVDTSEDIKKQLIFQNTEEEEEEEEVRLEAKNQAPETLGEVVQGETPESRTHLDGYVDCPEEAKADLDDKSNQEVDKVKTPEGDTVGDGKVSELDNDATHPLGTDGEGEVSPSEVAEAGSIGEASTPAKKVMEQSQMSKLENKGAVGSGLENEGAPSSPSDSSPTETMEGNSEQSDEQPETAEEALESNSLDSNELRDPAGSLKVASKEDTQGTSKGKDKNKEECALS
ncbi:leucine-rich repeat flightless-interacting protein 1 isoform X26 [Petaurus breviceps papuanus]|uniref:leucine-rich repeat flightless-interacting protein 1 isoform X26 n=1 Tax=Petaurus breviceps papuanus TaxID=3040969 RepID=UPI0036DDAC90